MANMVPESWSDDLSGRDRVRYVVELLDEPTPVQQIADRADVSRATAADELERLANDDWVTETTIDSKQAYDLNPVRLLFDEITDLIHDNSRGELEQQLTELKSEQESLCDEYDADSLTKFRQQLSREDLSAAELRDRQNVIASWEALNTELSLVQHALQLYEDVEELSTRRSESQSTLPI